jgi:hypothetical protein
MITCIIIAILLIIAAISDAVMDVISFKFYQSVFSKFKKHENWFNPLISWKNKYKNCDPSKGPAFLGSTTVFSWLTDAWHFFQMIMLSCFNIAIVLGINYIFFLNYTIWSLFIIDIIMFIIIKFLYGLIFEIFWKKIFIKKK